MHVLFCEVSQALVRPAVGFINSIWPVYEAHKQDVPVQQVVGPSK